MYLVKTWHFYVKYMKVFFYIFSVIAFKNLWCNDHDCNLLQCSFFYFLFFQSSYNTLLQFKHIIESHFGSWTLTPDFPYNLYLSKSLHKSVILLEPDKVVFRRLLRNFWRIVLIEWRRNSPASPSALCFWSSAQRLRDKNNCWSQCFNNHKINNTQISVRLTVRSQRVCVIKNYITAHRSLSHFLPF